MNEARRADGKVVGEFVNDQGDIWLVKRGLDETKHMLLEPKGWATEKEHIEKLQQYNGRGVRIETVQGRIWIGTLQAFLSYGVPLDRGYGPQVALHLRYWREISGGNQLPLKLKEA